MSADELYDLTKRQPFEPFSMRLHDGREFEVRHPDTMIVGKRFVILGLYKDRDGGPVDRWVWLNYFAIASMEPVNGAAKRRRRK